MSAPTVPGKSRGRRGAPRVLAGVPWSRCGNYHWQELFREPMAVQKTQRSFTLAQDEAAPYKDMNGQSRAVAKGQDRQLAFFQRVAGSGTNGILLQAGKSVFHWNSRADEFARKIGEFLGRAIRNI